MDPALQELFQPYPNIVRNHFQVRKKQIEQRVQGCDIIVLFESEVMRRGPGVMRATLESRTFDDFTPETRKTGGKCFFFSDLYTVTTIGQINEMFMKVEAVLASVQPSFSHHYEEELSDL